MALGANVWNMAFYGCFIGAMVIWRLVMKNGASKKKIMAASIIGCVVTLQLGAFSVTLETLAFRNYRTSFYCICFSNAANTFVHRIG